VLAKKHVFGSSVGYRGGGCQTLACAVEVRAYIDNYGFSVICRVTVMVLQLSGVVNLTYNGPAIKVRF
jgi:hypothetical protein